MIRRLSRLILRPVLLVLALLWVPYAILWVLDLEVVWPVPTFEAFVGYALIALVLVLVACVLVRARFAALIAAIGLVVLIVPRAGQATTNRQPANDGGRTLVVASSNVQLGDGDTAVLLKLVRDQHVDLLALQENTPGFERKMIAGGLLRLLPYGVAKPIPGAAGLSLYSRTPITEVPRKLPARRSVGGLVQLPGGHVLSVRSVHPPPPVSRGNLHCWSVCTRAYPGPADAGVPTILAGDFNATLNHHPLRDLIGKGYHDAAEQVGVGWKPTWSNARWATLTIDHVLVPTSVAVQAVTIHDLPLSDHDVVVATLRLPR